MAQPLLKSKKRNTEAEWWEAFNRCTEFVSKSDIDRKIEIAIERLRKNLRGRQPVCCWSGGKDAQVLRLVCEQAGYTDFTMGCGGGIEYPEFFRWAMQNKPASTQVYIWQPDFDYLNAHAELIFPTQSSHTYWYYTHVNQQSWYKHCAEYGSDALILGHRVKDGNQCGENGVSERQGILKVSPIYDFTHEDIFAAIRYYNIPMAPIYRWPDGFKEGTHTVIARSGKAGKDRAMDAIMEIDRTILPRLAPKIELIHQYCEKRGITND